MQQRSAGAGTELLEPACVLEKPRTGLARLSERDKNARQNGQLDRCEHEPFPLERGASNSYASAIR